MIRSHEPLGSSGLTRHNAPGVERANDPNAVAMAILRIAVGLFFVVFGQYKVFGTEFTLHGGFQDGVKGFISSGSAYPFMVPFLRMTLAHGAIPIAFWVAYGELAIGLSLVIGVLSRVASAFGFALMILLWLSGGYPGAHSAFWAYWASSENWTILALCFAVMMIGRPEDRWSFRRVIRT
jgi:thiosulfate dehydrogenase [quinone] large subunit